MVCRETGFTLFSKVNLKCSDQSFSPNLVLTGPVGKAAAWLLRQMECAAWEQSCQDWGLRPVHLPGPRAQACASFLVGCLSFAAPRSGSAADSHTATSYGLKQCKGLKHCISFITVILKFVVYLLYFPFKSFWLEDSHKENEQNEKLHETIIVYNLH